MLSQHNELNFLTGREITITKEYFQGRERSIKKYTGFLRGVSAIQRTEQLDASKVWWLLDADGADILFAEDDGWVITKH
ncbi:hypothetical protein [Labrys neptuniae]